MKSNLRSIGTVSSPDAPHPQAGIRFRPTHSTTVKTPSHPTGTPDLTGAGISHIGAMLLPRGILHPTPTDTPTHLCEDHLPWTITEAPLPPGYLSGDPLPNHGLRVGRDHPDGFLRSLPRGPLCDWAPLRGWLRPTCHHGCTTTLTYTTALSL